MSMKSSPALIGMSKMEAVLLASGGLDSTTMVYWLLSEEIDFVPLFIDYGQHCATTELETLRKVLPPSHISKIETLDISAIYKNSTSRFIRPANLWQDEIVADDLYIPNRNVLLLTVGASFARTLGISHVYATFINSNHAKEVDCSNQFFEMHYIVQARKLADYIVSLEGEFQTYNSRRGTPYSHIGALYTNIILQAGLNYNTVVKPRVDRVLVNYPEASTSSKFKCLADEQGLGQIIAWRDQVKLRRLQDILEFSIHRSIETCEDLSSFMSLKSNHALLLNLQGIGLKTLDYLLNLLHFDTVEVDRHIYSFVALATVEVKGYAETKQIVEYAADLLCMSRSSIDYSIWRYMSDRRIATHMPVLQRTFEFSTK